MESGESTILLTKRAEALKSQENVIQGMESNRTMHLKPFVLKVELGYAPKLRF
jgi:hypothetical protein